MTAVDTNVLIRLLTGDDARQTAAAKTLLKAGPIWIARTVLLETAWVLRSLYNFDEVAIRDALRKLLGLPSVAVEDEAAVGAAFDLADRGIDFADALHLASRPSGSAFATFDHAFSRRARRAGAVNVLGLGKARS